MKTDRFGNLIFDSSDIVNFYLRGVDPNVFHGMMVDDSVNLDAAAHILENAPAFIKYNDDQYLCYSTVEEFDQAQQLIWYMPQQYKDLDIAEYVLNLCNNDAELQRCGQELMMFQERNLFNLLRYLKYLVDLMQEHRLIWGVGRGSSVSSFVLYKLGVHRIDSMYYELDPSEFLR